MTAATLPMCENTRILLDEMRKVITEPAGLASTPTAAVFGPIRLWEISNTSKPKTSGVASRERCYPGKPRLTQGATTKLRKH